MFEKRLSDLVKGIRNNKKNETQYINQCIQEIKVELKSPDYNIKSQAVLKLTYLLMLGYDMNWAAFNVVEVMSQPKFEFKRIGYLAASQAFDDSTEVSMLCTQLIRKDISSTQYEAGVALNCLANIVTHDLGEDLAADVVAILNTSRTFVRKKAVLVLYKIFLKYPEALRPSWPRLKEKLEDPDMQVVASAVTVVCELAKKNAKNYISLSPILFKLLTASSNNWMLIKIVKLFGQLIPLEKRLTKKLVEPLSNLINTTPAMSLLYECIRTCTTTALNQNLPLVRLCITKLKLFIEDPDQNLKYLGLSALYSIMEEHPKAVSEHRDTVVLCLDDPDVHIRLRALDLLTGMVSKKNLVEIVQKLLDKIEYSEGQWKDNLVEKIVFMCSNNSYALLRDFEWYLTVLTELSHVTGTSHGSLIASQFMDVAIRVKVVRKTAVSTMTQLLRDPRLLSETDPNSNSMCEVLSAASWIVGEFIEQSEEPLELVSSMLQARVLALPSHIQSIYMQNLLKIFTFMIKKEQEGEEEEEEENTLDRLFKEIHQRIGPFIQSTNLEVQERSCFFYSIVKLMEESRKNGDIGSTYQELCSFFEEPLHPVAPKVQSKVPVPEGLDLEQQINDPPEEESDDDDDDIYQSSATIFPTFKKTEVESSDESSDEDPLPTKETKLSKGRYNEEKHDDPDRDVYNLNKFKPKPPPEIGPITELTNDDLGLKGSAKNLKGNKSKKVKRPQVHYEVDNVFDTPEGIELESKKGKKKSSIETSSSEFDPLSNVDLLSALQPHETLVVRTHRKNQISAPTSRTESKKKKGKKAKEEQVQEQEKTKKGKGKKKGKKTKDEPQELLDIPSTTTSSSSSSSSSSSFQSFQNSTPDTTSSSTTSSFSNSFLSPLTNSLSSFLPSSESSTPTSSTGLLGPNEYRPSELSNTTKSSPADDFFGSSKPKKKNEKKLTKKKDTAKEANQKKKKTKIASVVTEEEEPPKLKKKKKQTNDNNAQEQIITIPKHKKLYEDENVKIFYEPSVSSTEPNRIQLNLSITNLSAEPNEIAVKVKGTLNLKVIQTPVSLNLASGTTGTVVMICQAGSIVVPQKLDGTLMYSGLETPQKVQFLFPCSYFLVPVSLSQDQFQNILSSNQTMSLSSTSIAVSPTDTPNSVSSILASLLNLKIIDTVGQAVCLYGNTIQKHPVCALVKQKGQGAMSVDFKSSENSLASSLSSETREFFATRSMPTTLLD